MSRLVPAESTRVAAGAAAREVARVLPDRWRKPVDDVVASAVGAVHRNDPIAPATGGPAGNARLTAWLGLVLLVAFVVECFTLVSLGSLIDVHILVGAALIPLVLVKTVTTGWRIVRYYLGSPAYRQGGPPPLILRVVGPLVVLSGLAVLGSGIALLVQGPDGYPPATVAGVPLDALTLHKISFVGWLAITAFHALARVVPALQLTARNSGPPVPGGRRRGSALVAVLALSVATGLLTLALAGDWTHRGAPGGGFRHDQRAGP